MALYEVRAPPFYRGNWQGDYIYICFVYLHYNTLYTYKHTCLYTRSLFHICATPLPKKRTFQQHGFKKNRQLHVFHQPPSVTLAPKTWASSPNPCCRRKGRRYCGCRCLGRGLDQGSARHHRWMT